MASEVILSIDIGIHNLGYAIYDESYEIPLIFDLYDLDDKITKADKKNKIILARAKYIYDFVSDLFINHDISKVIIERQVNTNTRAMELMYLLTMAIYPYCDNIDIFDPKRKFSSVGLSYDTKNKAHKRLSIKVVKGYIKDYYYSLSSYFNRFNKKDDISDAVFMLLVSKYENDKNILSALRTYGEKQESALYGIPTRKRQSTTSTRRRRQPIKDNDTQADSRTDGTEEENDALEQIEENDDFEEEIPEDNQ